ncbi:MAG TPA: multicopper oxidase family protein, partial [Propionicimonas sp.]|nr:multicopper oxidase family protein [Propionicimonas sp.]
MALRGRVRLWLACAATAAVVVPLGTLWQASLVPDSYDMATMGYADWGGGARGSHAGHHGTAVAGLT